MVRDEDGPEHFLHSKEGVTQGDPLSMIAYNIGNLPLICELHTTHPHVTQQCYADDSGTVGTFEALHGNTRDLLVRGPTWEYLPGMINIILFIFLWNF